MNLQRFLFSVIILLIPVFSFIQKDEITIFLVGDSTVADKPYKTGNPEKGWGQVFPLYFKEGVKIDNNALNGRSTKSFMDEGHWAKVLELVQPGDYVIIEFGHNDQKIESLDRYADPDSAYRINLKKYISDTRAKGGKPVLATPIVRRRFDEDGKFYDTHTTYPDVVREVADSENVPLLDLHKQSMELLKAYGEQSSKKLFLHLNSGEYESLPKGKADDTHLSGSGAFRIADLVVAGMRTAIPELVQYLKK